MATVRRRRRAYLRHLDSAKHAVETAVDTYNRVWQPYRNEATLLVLANAWELLAKAVLLYEGDSIARGKRGETISAEVAIHRLQLKNILTQQQAETLQQIVSLRNEACHGILPSVPVEIMQHLLFFGCKFFRELIAKKFPAHVKGMSENYLSLSFSELTTYADRVQKAVSRVKRSPSDKRLVWLLERGIAFDGSAYITQAQFEQQYRGKWKILPHMAVNQYLKNAEMVRIVPIQAPRNFTADVILRKGSGADAALPVVVKRTQIEDDYPYLTKELGKHLNKSQNWTARAIGVLGLKGQAKYHQAVRASKSSIVHRYSEAALQVLQNTLKTEPGFDPYRAKARGAEPA